MAEPHQLFGSCACERNQYEVTIPVASASSATVFFDNTTLSRRVQAAPVTAWLRVPLDWFSSSTIAFFPDETHRSIKRTFHTPSADPASPPTRRSFCGYCGSHLTQWNEGPYTSYTNINGAGYLDVTLGSLLDESMERLEALRILPDGELDEEDEPTTQENSEGLVQGMTINDEDHILTNEGAIGGVDGPSSSVATSAPAIPLGTGASPTRALRPHPPHLMTGRGMPYFEHLVEDSRFGRIKRQFGSQTSRDGARIVQWEVTEIGGSPEPVGDVEEYSGGGTKRRKLAS